MKMFTLAPLALAVSCSISLLTACGGGSSDGTTDASISGSIVAAPVNNADVSVTDTNGNVVAGPVKTNNSGQYSLTIPAGSLGQALIIKATGGTYTDEATGTISVNAGEMLAYVTANSLSNGSSVSTTPGSTIIANLVNNGKSLASAETDFSTAFGYTPDISVVPVDATAPGTSASEASLLAGYRAAAFSQLNTDLGLGSNQQFDMIAALTKDLSDGTLDGANASVAITIGTTGPALQADIQNRFATAMVNFHTNTFNSTELAHDQIGNVPFAKIAFTIDDPNITNPTSTYQIEYIPGTMAAMKGKTTFTLQVTDRNNPTANTSGLSLTLNPIMYMTTATMTHGTPQPVNAITDNNDGTYTATVYYTMESSMANGTSMGFWDLGITVTDVSESAHFYPNVMMSMGDTAKTQLKGQSLDQVNMMGMVGGRNYYIYNNKDNSLSGMGPYTFSIFIAAEENMTSIPALVNSGTLGSGTGIDNLIISSIVVEISIDDGANWTTATTAGTDGIWSVTGLALTSGQESQIRVRLTVNGEVKTTDGLAADGSNDYATFTVTPGSM